MMNMIKLRSGDIDWSRISTKLYEWYDSDTRISYEFGGTTPVTEYRVYHNKGQTHNSGIIWRVAKSGLDADEINEYKFPIKETPSDLSIHTSKKIYKWFLDNPCAVVTVPEGFPMPMKQQDRLFRADDKITVEFTVAKDQTISNSAVVLKYGERNVQLFPSHMNIVSVVPAPEPPPIKIGDLVQMKVAPSVVYEVIFEYDDFGTEKVLIKDNLGGRVYPQTKDTLKHYESN